MNTAIGQLKAKSKAHCTICGCGTTRTIVENVYENTPADIERAKAEITAKASKKYTCRVCKSIEKGL